MLFVAAQANGHDVTWNNSNTNFTQLNIVSE